jgi:hypothetical protein
VARERNLADPTWPRRQFSYVIATKYGLTREAYDALVVEHEGRCGICSVPTPDLVVDHCHDTGRVRGLLCRKHNAGLGLLGDDVAGLTAALQYLTDHLG